MVKLTKGLFAIALGLILSLGLFTSGAFAQSATQGDQSVQTPAMAGTHAIIPQGSVQSLNLRQNNAFPRGIGYNRMYRNRRIGFIRPVRYNRVVIRPVRYNRVVIRPIRRNRVFIRPVRFNRFFVRPVRYNRVVIRPVRYNRVVIRPIRRNRVYIRPTRFNRVYVNRFTRFPGR